MKTKKLITILLGVLLIASTCVVTAMGYNKTFSNGYSYSAKDSKGYVKMEYMHTPNAHVVNTYATNLNSTKTSIKVNLCAQAINKKTDKVKTESIATRTIAPNAKSGVGASDYRSTNTNVYYWHEVDIFGNLSTSTIVSTVYKTVG